jgi:hypothetical protein
MRPSSRAFHAQRGTSCWLVSTSTRPERKALQMAYELQPSSYEELVALQGLGPRRIRALSLISELIYGVSLSLRDSAKFSFAHGGKDGTPFPMDRDTYDRSIITAPRCHRGRPTGQEEEVRSHQETGQGMRRSICPKSRAKKGANISYYSLIFLNISLHKVYFL